MGVYIQRNEGFCLKARTIYFCETPLFLVDDFIGDCKIQRHASDNNDDM
jgi:hypothetical protein